jgi:hypothetical protein
MGQGCAAMAPPFFPDVWQTKDFKSNDFVCVARKEVSAGICVCVASKGLREKQDREIRKLKKG